MTVPEKLASQKPDNYTTYAAHMETVAKDKEKKDAEIKAKKEARQKEQKEKGDQMEVMGEKEKGKKKNRGHLYHYNPPLFLYSLPFHLPRHIDLGCHSNLDNRNSPDTHILVDNRNHNLAAVVDFFALDFFSFLFLFPPSLPFDHLFLFALFVV
jgi:hypothetical protein